MPKLCYIFQQIACVGLCVMSTVLVAADTPSTAAAKDPAVDPVAKGRELVMDRAKGNCLACHMINDPEAKSPGNIGPPLIAIQQRFPDKTRLRAQIWDSTVNNPETVMPPFGRHQILSPSEIDQVVEYIYTL